MSFHLTLILANRIRQCSVARAAFSSIECKDRSLVYEQVFNYRLSSHYRTHCHLMQPGKLGDRSGQLWSMWPSSCRSGGQSHTEAEVFCMFAHTSYISHFCHMQDLDSILLQRQFGTWASRGPCPSVPSLSATA